VVRGVTEEDLKGKRPVHQPEDLRGEGRRGRQSRIPLTLHGETAEETEAMKRHAMIATLTSLVLVTAGTAQQPTAGDQALPKGFKTTPVLKSVQTASNMKIEYSKAGQASSATVSGIYTRYRVGGAALMSRARTRAPAPLPGHRAPESRPGAHPRRLATGGSRCRAFWPPPFRWRPLDSPW
jgi:hypothetical protein